MMDATEGSWIMPLSSLSIMVALTPKKITLTQAVMANVTPTGVLDGIGKGLDPQIDITEIAKPYALELLRFREVGVEVVLKAIF
ncbi:hypothetical protein V6N13_110567 [Hibiscus sabdariffa]